jgi:tRNA pseudouridine55 synthase
MPRNDLYKDREGLILIDKPLQWTSFDVIKKLRGIAGIKKIGHAGTLDPLASGLLIVCFGKHTRKISQIQDLPKTYQGAFYIGKTTASFDLETEPGPDLPIEHINQKRINDARLKFTGIIQQTPPLYSAIKVEGKRAYELARSGEQRELKSREVEIYSFEILNIDLPLIEFQVKCSKGKYIRSLARDFGEALNSGAHLTELRRTFIGEYSLEKACRPEEIESTEDFFARSIQI